MGKPFASLDAIDRKLITELDRNARVSYSHLAARLDIPAETLRYRLTTLLDRGAISAFYTVIDAGQLGCSVHKGLIKLHNVDEERVERIIAYLVKHPLINWVVRLDGAFDVSFTLWASTLAEVSSFIDEFKSKFHIYITKVALAVNIEAEFLPREFGGRGRKNLARQARYSVSQSAYRLDDTDLAILRALASDPRAPATEIARTAKVTSETVAKRMANMEEHRIIGGYRLVLDSSLLGEQNFYVLVYLNLVSKDKIEKFVQYCREQLAVNYIIKALGEWDYELNVEVANFLECRTLMMDLTRQFSEIIRDYAAMPVSKIHKFMIMPPGALRT